MKFTLLTTLAVLSVLLAACASPQGMESTPTTPPTELPPTATVIWFPATATPTPFPTRGVTPTPEMLTGIGPLAFEDDFSNPSAWESLQRPSGQVAIAPGELAISLSGTNGYLFSLRNDPQLADYYLETSLQSNLCAPGDSFGMLLRASTFQDYYRWSINCDGYQRVERIRAGNVTVLQDWTPSAQVLPGAPQVFRLGLLADGGELRFFVEDAYQFSVRDGAFPAGGVGFFARSSGDSPVSVSLRDLQFFSLDASAPIPTPRRSSPLQPSPTPD